MADIKSTLESIYKDWFVSPLGTRQSMLPFFKDPNQYEANKEQTVVPQSFSFKYENWDNSYRLSDNISILPKSFYSKQGKLFKDDISNNQRKITFVNQEGSLEKSDFIDLKTILNTIPAIQIREYQVEQGFAQWISLIFEIWNQIQTGFTRLQGKNGELDNGINGIWGKSKEVFTGIWGALNGLWDFFTSGDYLNTIDAECNTQFINQNGLKQSDYRSLISIMYLIYLKLKTCQTTNIYELPWMYSLDSKSLYDINQVGWKSTPFGFSGETLYSAISGVGGLIGKIIPGIGKLSEIVARPFKQLSMDSFPQWTPSEVKGPSFSFKFYLFNDSTEATLNNFIFINTIIPNSLWYQSGLVKFPPAIYDIKIPGVRNLYACSAHYIVDGAGVLRQPSLDVLGKIANHGNRYYPNLRDIKYLVENKMVLIPDVYSVSVIFESMLPENFNTWLFNTANSNILKKYNNKNIAYEKSLMTDIGKEIAEVMKNGYLKAIEKSEDIINKKNLEEVKENAAWRDTSESDTQNQEVTDKAADEAYNSDKTYNQKLINSLGY